MTANLTLGVVQQEQDHGPRTVYVKGTYGLSEVGVGSVEATLLWESDTDEYGAFTHLSQTPDHRLWLSFTDMEEHGGSYVSVEVTTNDLESLCEALKRS